VSSTPYTTVSMIAVVVVELGEEVVALREA
jgi:hypothetical protein